MIIRASFFILDTILRGVDTNGVPSNHAETFKIFSFHGLMTQLSGYQKVHGIFIVSVEQPLSTADRSIKH